MHARVSRYSGDIELLRSGFDAANAELERLDGFVQALFLADREHSRAMTITLWESAEAMAATADRAHQMRTRATEPANATTESVESYEVLLKVPSA
jgi:heme-degrading monooxygenase HmoA